MTHTAAQAAAKLTKPDHNLPRTIRARTDQTTDPLPEGKTVAGPTCAKILSRACAAAWQQVEVRRSACCPVGKVFGEQSKTVHGLPSMCSRTP